MLKIFLIVLVASTLSDFSFALTNFTPAFDECGYNLTLAFDGKDVFNVFGYDEEDLYALQVNKLDSFYLTIRCDVFPETCYVKQNNSECTGKKCSKAEALTFFGYFPTIEYNETKYPEACSCPDGNTNCKKYCNASNTCYVVDTQERIIAFDSENSKDSYTVKYHTLVDPLAFEEEDCYGVFFFPPFPVNPCGLYGNFTPSLECSFNVTLSFNSKIGLQTKTSIFGYFYNNSYTAQIEDDFGYRTYRCDMYDEKEDSCLVLKYATQTKEGQSYYERKSVINSFFTDHYFPVVNHDTTYFPKDVACPDGESGCKYYYGIDGSSAVYSIADENNKLLQYGYVNEAHSADTFYSYHAFVNPSAFIDMNPVPLPVPENPCAAFEGSSSVVSHSSSGTANDLLGVYIAIPIVVVAIIAIIILFATPLRHRILGACHSDNAFRKRSDNTLSLVIDGKERRMDLVKEIGRGAFGTVWLAKSGTLELAAKEMLKDAQLDNNEVGNWKEVEIMSHLHSPYIVRIYGSCANAKSLFMFMEYIPNGSLATAIRDYTFSPYMRCRFMLDVARGMEYLHSQGVIHRDLKPGNVLVNSFDPNADVLCKITDFGESRQGLEMTLSVTMTRGVGTPYYMAPEMMRGDKKYTRGVDVYSFSIMCVEVWNERLPYSELDFEDEIEFFSHVTKGKRPAVSKDCPRKLKKLIEECWASDRRLRPPFTDVVKDCSIIVDDIAKSQPENVVHVKKLDNETIEQIEEITDVSESKQDKPEKSPKNDDGHKHKNKKHHKRKKHHKNKSHKSSDSVVKDGNNPDEIPLDDLDYQFALTRI